MVPDIAYMDVMGEAYLHETSVGSADCCERGIFTLESKGDLCLRLVIEHHLMTSLMTRLLAACAEPDQTLPGLVLLWLGDRAPTQPRQVPAEDLLATAYLLRESLSEDELWEEPGRLAAFLARFGRAVLRTREKIYASFS